MIAVRGIAALRLLAGAFLAIGFAMGGALTHAAPAEADQAPWYMPQPWVHPQATGPKVRALPGYYGHNLRHRTYGSFSTGCYGDCGMVRGTVTNGAGVVFSRPVMAIYDPGQYTVVPLSYLAQRASYTTYRVVQAQPVRAVQPRMVSVQKPTARKPLPQFSVQNGVRIIRPTPMPTN